MRGTSFQRKRLNPTCERLDAISSLGITRGTASRNESRESTGAVLQAGKRVHAHSQPADSTQRDAAADGRGVNNNEGRRPARTPPRASFRKRAVKVLP